MRLILIALTSCVLAACATSPDVDTPSQRDRMLTTGSNIPRKGQASTVDKDSISDAIIRSGGARAGGS